MTIALPVHPRLADHALARRHLIDGVELVVLHDARTGELYKLSPPEWEIVSHADGTRDVDGVCLAAARAGGYRRASEVRRLLEQLHAWDLLSDGIAPVVPAAEVWSDRLLDPFPDFGLTCDGSGSCCAMYATVLFSAEEAERARVTLPRPLGLAADDRLFLPAQGDPGRRPDAFAVTLVDGRCAYLDGEARCRLHAAAGADKKPYACRAYPATFVDDGEVVRVSVAVECACVLASIGRSGGEPIVPAGARTMGDLPGRPRVVRLPDRIRVAGDVHASRAEMIAWSRAVVAAPAPVDALDACWRLAGILSARGLDVERSRAALAGTAGDPASPGDLAPWLSALALRAEARVAAAEAWRSSRDRVRRAAGWIAAAAHALSSRPELVATSLAAGPAHAASEAFYVRTAVHGHQLVEADRDLGVATALRDRAVRMLLARVLPGHTPADDIAHAHPLALVEAMMRAQGLRDYVEKRDAG